MSMVCVLRKPSFCLPVKKSRNVSYYYVDEVNPLVLAYLIGIGILSCTYIKGVDKRYGLKLKFKK